MRRFACLALLVVVACKAKQTAPKQEAVAPATPDARTVAATEDARPAFDAEPVPKWANDPPEVLRGKIIGINAHVIVLKTSAHLTEYRDVLAKVERTPGVVAAAPFIFAELEIAKTGKPPVSVAIKAVDPKRVGRVLTVGKHMTEGTLESLAKGKPPSIVLGDVLAQTLGVKVGDEVTVTHPKMDDAFAGVLPEPKPGVFRVTGMFHMDFDEYDERLAFVPLAAMQEMLARGDQVMGIEMTVKDLDRSDEIAKAIETKLGGHPYDAQDWYELNQQLFVSLFGQRRP
ncbi:MAG TPA: ABC transporter permease [Kofleriaceae bacterium]